jgi:hypothetical protein
MNASGHRDSVRINYVARTPERPCYYANDHSRDTVVIEQHDMPAIDGREEALDLDGAGVKLVDAPSAITDFTDKANFPVYAAEVEVPISFASRALPSCVFLNGPDGPDQVTIVIRRGSPMST